MSICSLLIAGLALIASSPSDEDLEHFEAKVRPVLLEACSRCHGEKRQKSGLRLDRPMDLMAGGDRGPLLVPGDADASRLIRAIRYDDPELQMPPSGKLEDRVIRDLEHWVGAGAKVSETPVLEKPNRSARAVDPMRTTHWSFQPPRRPMLPPVERTDWPRDPVDDFILARLEAAGLEPAADADARSWLRRVTFDLVGLPPTPDEIADFLADTSSHARARVVDRLLGSPHFGERWGRHWLDVVAYAESRGHEFDYTIPNAWQYRDWVVRALNADVPYDRFVTEQLAGDLLDPPRRHPSRGFNESVVGTGVWRLGEAIHSPVDIRGDETERLAARVDVLGKAFLGLTTACARCHDHKFDPITARDYYALCGYFLSTSDRQVRFETAEHNAEIDRDLSTLHRTHESRLRRWLAERLEPVVASADALLLAAGEVLVRHESHLSGDRIFEDFEGAAWSGWTAEGEAFGTGPLRVAQLAEYQGNVGARGDGLVNSHNLPRPSGEVDHSDTFVGRLTSDPFPLEHRYVHFLIGGGPHSGQTAVQLLIDHEVVTEINGPANNRMRPGRLVVHPWRGRAARLRIVDESTEGWGNIGVDQIVLSDRASFFEGEDLPPSAEDLEAAVREVAFERGLEIDALSRWSVALAQATRDPEDVLHTFAHLATLPSEASGHGERRRLEKHWRQREQEAIGALDTVRWIASAQRPADWIFDGPTFDRPGRGSLRWGPSASRPVPGLRPEAAVEKDPIWDVLTLASGVEGSPSQLNWIQAGRTVRTRTFTVESGRLYYRVRGSGHAVALVASHRMLNGPLHTKVRTTWNGPNDREHWIEQDLTEYIGLRVHLEISPHDPTASSPGSSPPLAILAIVEATERPGEPSAAGALLFDALEQPRTATLEELAAAARRVWSDALRKLATGRLGASPRGGDEARWLERLLDVAGNLSLTDESLAAVFDEQSRLIEKIARVSQLAPALLEAHGVDERYLPRGSHRSAQDTVPRRDLSVLGGDQAIASAQVSGRRQLAARWTSGENPLVARVIVNRVWHHLFGRGIVASVDNFGLLGQRPSHPELLDHLATRFVDDGWSLKQLIRALVLSRLYGISSTSSGAAIERDPANHLWQHMPVKRLQGEVIRDAILALSGRLDRTLGGPSIPVYLTPFMQGRGRPGSGPLDGHGRRSLYTSVRRNFLSSFFLAFDTPVPMTTVGRRSVSNVPAQALTLLNDPLVHQEARRWAERELAVELADSARLVAMFEQAFTRPPTASESRSLLAYLEQRRAAGSDATRSWTDVAHVLFNLKEFAFVH